MLGTFRGVPRLAAIHDQIRTLAVDGLTDGVAQVVDVVLAALDLDDGVGRVPLCSLSLLLLPLRQSPRIARDLRGWLIRFQGNQAHRRDVRSHHGAQAINRARVGVGELLFGFRQLFLTRLWLTTTAKQHRERQDKKDQRRTTALSVARLEPAIQ